VQSVDFVTNGSGAISNITIQNNSMTYVAHCANFFQNVIISNIDIKNNFCDLTKELTNDDDVIQIAAGVGVIIEGNFLRNNAPGNSCCHDDNIQTYCPNSCSGSANPSKWTIRYNWIARGETSGAGGNMSWEEMEGLVGSTSATTNCSGATWAIKYYGNVFVGGSATWAGGNGIDLNSDEPNQSASDQICFFNNTLYQHADPINPLRGGSGPGTFYFRNNAMSGDASGCLSSGNCPGITYTAGVAWDYNMFFNWNGNCSSTFSGTHGSCSTNPQFTSTSTNDFSLAGGSPLLNAADATIGAEYSQGPCKGASWPNPALCARSVGNWDIGAYQFGGPAASPSCSPGSGNYTSTQTPACINPNPGITVQCITTNGTLPVTNSAGTGCTNGTLLASGGTVSIALVSQTLEIVAGTSTLTDSPVVSYTYLINAPSALPLKWVNNNEGNASYTYVLTFPGTWVGVTPAGWPTVLPYALTAAGGQQAILDIEAYRTATGKATRVHWPAGFLYSAANGPYIPQTATVAATQTNVLDSTDDAFLPNGRTVCSHGIQACREVLYTLLWPRESSRSPSDSAQGRSAGCRRKLTHGSARRSKAPGATCERVRVAPRAAPGRSCSNRARQGGRRSNPYQTRANRS
jgi:hypothetical protein